MPPSLSAVTWDFMGLCSLTLSLGDWVSYGHFLYLGVHVSMYESYCISRQLR